MQKLDLINKAKPSLTSVTFNKTGGVIRFKLGQSLIWPVPSKDGSGVLVVVMDKIHKNGVKVKTQK